MIEKHYVVKKDLKKRTLLNKKDLLYEKFKFTGKIYTAGILLEWKRFKVDKIIKFERFIINKLYRDKKTYNDKNYNLGRI